MSAETRTLTVFQFEAAPVPRFEEYARLKRLNPPELYKELEESPAARRRYRKFNFALILLCAHHTNTCSRRDQHVEDGEARI